MNPNQAHFQHQQMQQPNTQMQYMPNAAPQAAQQYAQQPQQQTHQSQYMPQGQGPQVQQYAGHQPAVNFQQPMMQQQIPQQQMQPQHVGQQMPQVQYQQQQYQQQPMNQNFAVQTPQGYQAQYSANQQGGIPQMNADELLGSLTTMTGGIGAAALPTDRLKPPLPGNCIRDFSIPPEQGDNIVSGSEAISFVRITGGIPRPKRQGGGFFMVKGTLLQTTGDTPVNSEVGFAIWPGDYYLRDMKQILVAAFNLKGPQLTNDALLQGLINNSFGTQPGQQMMVDKIIGCKTYVYTAKRSPFRKSIRWLTFPAQVNADGSLQLINVS